MDTARAKSLCCYGCSNKTTPFLDSLAEENVKYENAYSQANWTLPSHTSLFSGKYFSQHRIDKNYSFDGINTFIGDLSDKGYDTMGLTNVTYLSEDFDADQLFDEFFYNPGPSFFQDLEFGREDFHSQESFNKYLNLSKHLITNFRFDKPLKFLKRKSDNLLLRDDSGAAKTNEEIKNRLKDRDNSFFLFLNYLEPHTPYLPPFPYSHKFQENKFQWFNLINESAPGLGEDTGNRKEILTSLYEGEINYLDSRIKKVYNWIMERYPNTVFIFTSDHGEYIFEHGYQCHKDTNLHDEVTKVPLIEVLPENISENIENPVEIKDIGQHILQLAEGDFDPMDSKIAISEMLGQEKDAEQDREYLVSATDGENRLFWGSNSGKRMVSGSEDGEIEKKLSDKISGEVGDPEELNLVLGDSNINDEEVKEKLADLGYT
jgi:arylsulfatase A-like enzyme